MNCDRCKKNHAVIHVSRVEAGESVTWNLCESCALSEGVLYSYKPEILDLNLSGKRCSLCGLTEEIFLSKKLLGCSNCYETFYSKIEEVTRALQGAENHCESKGDLSCQIPLKGFRERNTIRAKQEAMAIAVQEERYEDAALLRDEIKELMGDLQKIEHGEG